MIKSIYSSNKDIMKAISILYVEQFDLDPTYSKGIIYKGVNKPLNISDIAPHGDYKKADCRNLDFKPGCLHSIMFDPPFLAGGGERGIMHDRFSSFKNVNEVLKFYNDSLTEFLRILTKKGILVFKCQDLLNGRVQTVSHCEIYNMALRLGFYARDLFVLQAKSRPTPHNVTKQVHSRKFHSFFWVFEKIAMKNKTF